MLFRSRKAIFVARAQQQPFGEGIEAESLGGLQFEPAGRAHQHRIFISRSEGIMFGESAEAGAAGIAVKVGGEQRLELGEAHRAAAQSGRASCRERGCEYV